MAKTEAPFTARGITRRLESELHLPTDTKRPLWLRLRGVMGAIRQKDALIQEVKTSALVRGVAGGINDDLIVDEGYWGPSFLSPEEAMRQRERAMNEAKRTQAIETKINEAQTQLFETLYSEIGKLRKTT